MMTQFKQVQRVGSYGWITSGNFVLLSLLNRGPNRGKWTLIGGGIDFGEAPIEALVREVNEEAGIDLSQIGAKPRLFDVFSHQHAFDENGVKTEMHFIGIIHLIELPSKMDCKAEGDGLSSDGTKWFEISKLDPATLNPSVLKMLSKLYG